MGAVPIVYAHRGGAALAPENTLGAFRGAHERLGDRGIGLELDVRLTRDGVPVVLHDRSLDRTTNRTGPLDDIDASDLAGADASALWTDHPPEPVPPFADVLSHGLRGGWRLMVELKAEDDEGAHAVADAAVDAVIERAFPPDHLFCACFRPAALERTKAREPGIRTAVLTSSMAPRPTTTADAIRMAADGGHDLVGPDLWSPDLGPESVARAHEASLEVIVWTVNEPGDVARLASWGVDGIVSDNPDAAYDALGA